jgi:hypothetical protein
MTCRTGGQRKNGSDVYMRRNFEERGRNRRLRQREKGRRWNVLR